MKNLFAIAITWLALSCAAMAQVPGAGAMVPNVACCKNVIGASPSTIAAATTSFVSFNSIGPNQNFASISPNNGTFRNLNVHTANAPGAGQTYVFTIFTGAAVTMSATLLTCTISGAVATTCTDVVDTGAILAGQSWSLQIVTSATATATGQWQFGIELDAF